jgi:hypothetical protein
VGDMELFVGGTRGGGIGGFYFNPHGALPPSIIDTTTVNGILEGPHTQTLIQSTNTLTIEKGTAPITPNVTGLKGSVGIRTSKGFLYNSTNALYVKGTTILGDSLVVNRRFRGSNDTYNPQFPTPSGGALGANEAVFQLDGPNHFEIHPPVTTANVDSKNITSKLFHLL